MAGTEKASVPSWQECLDAGMTQAEAARARGMLNSAASHWARRNGKSFALKENRGGRPRKPTLDLNKFQRCAEQGFTRREAAARLGVSMGSVVHTARKYGVDYAPAKPRRTVPRLEHLTDEKLNEYRFLRSKNIPADEALSIVERA